MPPKKGPRAPAKARTSKLAEELGLSAEEETEVLEAWEIFADREASEEAGVDVVARADVRRVLMALGLESTRDEMREILKTVDPDNEGYVSYERFLEVAALKMNYRDTREEAQKAFSLFTAGGPGPITMADLRRVATELKENVSDEQLSEMLAEACTREFGKSVDLTDFEGVMKRAGVL